MPITLFVRTGDQKVSPKLTFDGTQRVVLGRGTGCDVRLPDPSVSARHATVRSQGADFVVLDEGSLNGTYVGGERLATRMARSLKSGDRIRVGRVWIEVLVDATPVTRDAGNVAREIALALVEQGMRAVGEDVTPKVHVTEGPDVGVVLPLEDDGQPYLVGRGEDCDLALTDPEASPEELYVVRKGGSVIVRDAGSRGGILVGDTRVSPGRDVPWRGTLPLRTGRTVLALEEPVALALQELEAGPDEPMPDAPPPKAKPTSAPPPPPQRGSLPAPLKNDRRGAATWTAADVVVLLASVVVLALSVAGFLWLIRG